jgi:hypothetical protein
MSLIKLKRSATPNKVPLTTDLDLGEMAMNTNDGKLYIKKNVSSVETVVTISCVGATGGGADNVFLETSNTVTSDYTITTNKNAVTAGPVTVNSGITVTIPTGSVWTIV